MRGLQSLIDVKHSDDLYLLVKSLSKSEKRYFRLFASRYGGRKKYMLLFESIDRQESYDEEAIRAELDGESIARHLHVAKNYLYKLILRSLRAYYAESSTQIRVREMITDIEILFERGMFKQARKMWRAAQKWAERLDDPQLKLALIRLRHRLSGKDSDKLEALDDIHDARRKVLRELETVLEYEYVVEKLGNICTRNPSRGPAEYALLDETMESPLMKAEPTDAPFRVRQHYLWGWATYHYGRDELEPALDYMRRVRELCSANPDFLRNHPTEHLGIVANILTLLSRMEDEEEYRKELDALEETFHSLLPDTLVNTRVTALFQVAIFWNRLVFHTDRGDFDRCLTLAADVDRFLNDYPDFTINGDIPRLTFLLAYSCYGAGRHGDALRRMSPLLNASEPMKGRSGYYAARLMEIVIHYELGNMELVISRVRSLRNYLMGKDRYGPFERVALTFFEAAASGKDERCLLESLRKAFANFDRDWSGHRIFFYFDFIAWIECRIAGRPFADVVGERHRSARTGAANGFHTDLAVRTEGGIVADGGPS